jgi:hypothetical protein
MATPEGLAYYGQMGELAPLLSVVEYIRMHLAPPDGSIVLILPDGMIPGLTRAYGLDVIRSPDGPLVGLRPF